VVTAIAITVVVGAAALVLFLAANSGGTGPLGSIGTSIFELPVEPLATAQERVATRERLEEQYRWLTVEDSDAATFLLGEAKAAFDATRDGIKNLDAKAGTLIGIVTTGLGAIALLGDASKLPPRTGFLYIGLGFLTVSLFTTVNWTLGAANPTPSTATIVKAKP
jgi:hypothetical protein